MRSVDAQYDLNGISIVIHEFDRGMYMSVKWNQWMLSTLLQLVALCYINLYDGRIFREDILGDTIFWCYIAWVKDVRIQVGFNLQSGQMSPSTHAEESQFFNPCRRVANLLYMPKSHSPSDHVERSPSFTKGQKSHDSSLK